jgi:hypothetical protein
MSGNPFALIALEIRRCLSAGATPENDLGIARTSRGHVRRSTNAPLDARLDDERRRSRRIRLYLGINTLLMT